LGSVARSVDAPSQLACRFEWARSRHGNVRSVSRGHSWVILGAATIRAQGLETLGWIALVALVLGLFASAVLLAPWQLKKLAVPAELPAGSGLTSSVARSDQALPHWLIGGSSRIRSVVSRSDDTGAAYSPRWALVTPKGREQRRICRCLVP
jgi:hypothetical protein